MLCFCLSSLAEKLEVITTSLTLYKPKSHNLTKQQFDGSCLLWKFLKLCVLEKAPLLLQNLFPSSHSFLPPSSLGFSALIFFLTLSLPLLSLVSLDPIFTCPQFSPHLPAFLSSLLLSAHIFITLSSPSVFSRLSSISSKSSQSLLSPH